MCASQICSSLSLQTISITHAQNGCNTMIRLFVTKPELLFPGLFKILALTLESRALLNIP